MTTTDAQVRIAMRELEKGRSQEQAAAKANLRDRKTVGKYARLGKLPSELKQPRTYRTRPDPFAAHWPEVVTLLEQAPELEAKSVFAWLCERYPGQYQEGQVRTFQRRVTAWRGLNTSQVLDLPQVHPPGEALQTDGTSLNGLQITLAGQPFPHLLIHSVLPYSNWEWGRVAQSESLLAVQLGVYSALTRLGHVPKVHQTDNTTAATHTLGPEAAHQERASRGYNVAYLAWLNELGLTPRTTHLASPQENGDVEAAQGAFKRALEQHLLLRGSRDFTDLASYETFLFALFDRRNTLRQARLAEELALMRPLTQSLPPAQREWDVHVSRAGLIRVLNNTYAVPSGLAGRWVHCRVTEWQIAIWYAQQCVTTLPRLTGRDGHQVDFRYVIDSLLRKPGGFRHYRYREALFPTGVFRQAWEALDARLTPRRADLAYLRILKLAAQGLLCDVEAVLREVMASGVLWDDQLVRTRLQPSPGLMPVVLTLDVNLQEYDALLPEREPREEVAHDPPAA